MPERDEGSRIQEREFAFTSPVQMLWDLNKNWVRYSLGPSCFNASWHFEAVGQAYNGTTAKEILECRTRVVPSACPRLTFLVFFKPPSP